MAGSWPPEVEVESSELVAADGSLSLEVGRWTLV